MKKIYCYFMLLILVITSAACNTAKSGKGDSPGAEGTTIGASAEGTSAAAAEGKEDNQDIMILFTSDVHCGVDEGFGYAGLAQIRDTLKSRGYTTLLVDDARPSSITSQILWGERSDRAMRIPMVREGSQ
ncbi:MAG: hypothetical protein IJI25_11305 [Eubacterium sp.]|nr:hypothetical protein [Eubacterium sp.]